MTTKDQERKALEKIKKIIAELGENSYIGTAFEGCIEDAEQNIDWDVAFSMKARLESADKAYTECFDKLQTAEASIKILREEIQELKEDANALNERIDNLRKDKFNAIEEVNKARRDVTIATGENEEVKPFARIQYVNNNGFQFVTITQENGWADSYKVEEITKLVIE